MLVSETSPSSLAATYTPAPARQPQQDKVPQRTPVKDSVTISKQAQQLASDGDTQAQEISESGAEKASEISRVKA